MHNHWFQRHDVQFIERHLERLLIGNHGLEIVSILTMPVRLDHRSNQRSGDIRRDRFVSLSRAFGR